MIKIDLYSEISCPWCLIGMHRLDKVIAERFSGLDFDIEHHPVILLQDCPPEGLKIVDLIRSRYGITDPAAGWARPHEEARISGLALDLSRQPLAFPTIGGHTLIRLARARGTQHKLAKALSQAYFLEAQNTGDPQVLAQIAAHHGFEPGEAERLAQDAVELNLTRQDVERSRTQGVTSVPRFVFNGKITLDGNQSEAALAKAIDRAAEF